jgi:hypothetical protein
MAFVAPCSVHTHDEHFIFNCVNYLLSYFCHDGEGAPPPHK